MKNKILMIIAMLIVALPVVLATSHDDFVGPDDFVVPIANTYIAANYIEDYGAIPTEGVARLIKESAGVTLIIDDERTVMVKQLEDDNVILGITLGIFDKSISMYVGETVNLDTDANGAYDLEIYFHKVHQNAADLVFKKIPTSTENVHVYISSLKVISHSKGSNGYLYVPDGAKVTFEAIIEADEDVDNVDYVFYNNGYPTGDGATEKETGSVDLKKGINFIKETMEFHYKDDTKYNTGSFITVFIIDPNNEKTDGGYYGTTLYVTPSKKDVPTIIYETYPVIPEPTITSPADPTDGLKSGYDYITLNIHEGETKHLNFMGGESYEIEVLIIEDNKYDLPYVAILEVDGEVTNRLKEGDSVKFESGEVLLVAGFSYDIGVNKDAVKIHFTLNPSKDYIDTSTGIAYPEEFIDTIPNPTECFNGCYVNSDTNKCLPYGTRLEQKNVGMFCDIDGSLRTQKLDGEYANNNYECESNSARYGECEPVREQTVILRKIFDWLSRRICCSRCVCYKKSTTIVHV